MSTGIPARWKAARRVGLSSIGCNPAENNAVIQPDDGQHGARYRSAPGGQGTSAQRLAIAGVDESGGVAQRPTQ
jgi:hypothetical protein